MGDTISDMHVNLNVDDVDDDEHRQWYRWYLKLL